MIKNKLKTIVINIKGEFIDSDDFTGYVTEDEYLIWLYGGVRSCVALGCGPFRHILGQPLANTFCKPLINKYNKSRHVLVNITGHRIEDIILDVDQMLEGLLCIY